MNEPKLRKMLGMFENVNFCLVLEMDKIRSEIIVYDILRGRWIWVVERAFNKF